MIVKKGIPAFIRLTHEWMGNPAGCVMRLSEMLADRLVNVQGIAEYVEEGAENKIVATKAIKQPEVNKMVESSPVEKKLKKKVGRPKKRGRPSKTRK
jgi:hypothetical protein